MYNSLLCGYFDGCDCTSLHSVSTAHKGQKVKKQVSRGDSSAKDSSETGSLSSLSIASTSADTTNKLHQAYLEVVYGLSSDVSLKKNSMTLNM